MSASRMANSNCSELDASRRNQFVCRADCRSTALATMLDLDYRARSQPHDLRRRILQADAYRESLCHTHPVERALHVGIRAGHVDSILIQHPPTNAVDNPADRQAAIDHRIDRYAVAGMYRGEIRLAKIGGSEPFFSIDESEQRLARGHEFAAGDSESDNQPVVCRAYRRVVQIALRQRERRLPCCDHRFGGL